MQFKKGQKVLCVHESFRTYCAFPVIKGVVYTIDGFYTCVCGSTQVTLAERLCIIDMNCRCGIVSYRRQSYYNWRFIPLEYFEKFISLSDKKTSPEEIVKVSPEIQEVMIKNLMVLHTAVRSNIPERFVN